MYPLSLNLFLLRSTVKVCVVPFVRAAWWSQSEPLSPSLCATAAGPVSTIVLMKKSISCYQFHSAFTSSPPPPVFISEELVIRAINNNNCLLHEYHNILYKVSSSQISFTFIVFFWFVLAFKYLREPNGNIGDLVLNI